MIQSLYTQCLCCRYELIEVPDHPIERWMNVILKARYGIKIQFKPIKR